MLQKTMFAFALVSLLTSVMVGSVAAQPQSATAATMPSTLAPTGVLRASINVGNPILAKRDAATGQAQGVSVDMAQALAQRLGVPLQLQVFASAGASVKALTQGEADIGFFALDPVRGEGVLFSQAYVLIEGSYLVRNDSPLRDNAQVDQAGMRVAVGLGSAYDLFLTRALTQAQLVRAPTSPQVVDFFLNSQLEVAAGVKQQLEIDAQRLPGLRLLPGRFMVIAQAMAVPKNHGLAAAEQLDAFVADMKASGFVAQSLMRHHIEGASIAP